MRDEKIDAIVIGVDEKSSREAIELTEKYENLFAAIGIHPIYTEKEFDEKSFRELVAHPKVVAIGECGLDYYREINAEIKNQQKELFKKQIALATEVDKPLIIHVRASKNSTDAYQDIIEILKEAKIKYPKLRGDIHFFAGGLAEAEAFLKLDFTISFTAVITFARDYDEVIKAVPLAYILAETDAPYVAQLLVAASATTHSPSSTSSPKSQKLEMKIQKSFELHFSKTPSVYSLYQTHIDFYKK